MNNIPDCAKHLPFSKYLTFYSNTFEFKYHLIGKEVNNIPRILHLIWVGDKDPPSYVMENIQQWNKLMPHWDIMFWTNNDLTTKHFPFSIINLLDKIKKGAQKADIMRYFIMEKFGGVYVDTDITPYHSLEPLITQIPNAEAIICHDLDVTWQYVANAFFAAIPNHPLFVKACELCNNVIINTEDIYMQTGPRLLGEAIAQLDYSSNIVLLPSKFLYRNLDFEGRLGNHFFAKEW